MKEKLKGEETYWLYFKQSNPSNYVNVRLPSKDDSGYDVISKREFYAVTYLERIEPSKLGNILSYSTTGAVAGGIICSFTGPATFICAAGGGIGGAVLAVLKNVGEDSVNWIMGKSPADGIEFRKYEDAKENCVTVERVKIESKDFDEKEFL